MNKFVLIFLSLSFGFITFSQNFHKTTITKTEEYKNSQLYYEKLFELENNILVVRYGPLVNSEVSFDVFSKQPFTRIANKIEKMPGEYLNVETVQQMNNQIYLFYSIFNGKQKASQLFAREINTQTGGFIGEPRQVLNITENLVYSSRQRGKFKFTMSEKNELLIEYSFVSKEKDVAKKQERIGVLVLDNEFNEAFNGTSIIPYPQNIVKTGNKAIDAKGNLYVLFAKTEGKSIKNGFFKISDNGNSMEEFNFDLNDVKINNSNFSVVNDQLICTGFYSKYQTKEATGLFLSYFNNNDVDLVKHDFSNDIISSYNGATSVLTGYKGGIISSNRGVLDMFVTNVVPLSNGELLIASNRRDSVWQARENGGQYLTFEYRDIILSKLDNKGDLIWMNKIPRCAVDEFKLFLDSNNDITLLLSDNPGNSTLPKNKVPQIPDWGGILTLCKVNDDGNREYIPLFKIREVDGNKLPRCEAKLLQVTSDKSFLFEAEIGQNKLKLFKAVID